MNLIHRENWGAETVSSFEYKLAKRVSAPSIILNGFNKRIYEKVLNDEKLFYIVIDSFDIVPKQKSYKIEKPFSMLGRINARKLHPLCKGIEI